jgi:hypothetical protein
MTRMRNSNWPGMAAFGAVLFAGTLLADNRIFTYSYEPETEPRGDWEYEQSVTLRAGRNATVGQADYQLWEFREEIEYGVTDRYTVALYVNHDYEHFNDPASGTTTSEPRWKGVSLENRYLVLDPVEHPIGLTLYLEPTYDGDNAELEQKIILGQRHGSWKWALNLTHATEWTDDFHDYEGELEISGGLAWQFSRRWSLGVEVRDHNELPAYQTWENTAVFFGPVVSYRRLKWWAALTVMPQIYGANFTGNPDRNPHLELEGHERLNMRLLFGFGF